VPVDEAADAVVEEADLHSGLSVTPGVLSSRRYKANGPRHCSRNCEQ
jgi:hypothetical protein